MTTVGGYRAPAANGPTRAPAPAKSPRTRGPADLQNADPRTRRPQTRQTPGVERFDYFRHLQRIRLGEVGPESLLEVQELCDNHFLQSAVWEQRN